MAMVRLKNTKTQGRNVLRWLWAVFVNVGKCLVRVVVTVFNCDQGQDCPNSKKTAEQWQDECRAKYPWWDP